MSSASRLGALADLRFDVRKILWYVEGGDDDEWEEEKEKRKKIPPEVLEKVLAEDENYQSLLRLIERAKIELATGKRPPPDPSGA